MPTFYFHLRGSLDRVDDTGLALEDVAQAHGAAVDLARSVMAEEVAKGRLPLNSFVEITDEESRSFFVAFREAVEIDDPNPDDRGSAA
jgi:hypothetical protein